MLDTGWGPWHNGYMSTAAINVGDTVEIKGEWSHDNIFAGEWGVVKMIKGGVYHVGLYGGDHAPIFNRRELKRIATRS